MAPQTKKAASKTKDLVIVFDMDNVLVDTRLSYLDCIRWTVEIYLTSGSVPLFEPAPRKMRPALLTKQDIETFKLLGGFNDDWDCCQGLLIYLLNLPVAKRSILELKKQMDFKALGKKIKTRPLRVHGLAKVFGRPATVRIEKIARIFQEIYLGRDLFRTFDRRMIKSDVQYWNKLGLIRKEKPVFRRSTLEKLKALGARLAIATGRSHVEAFHALKEFHIADLFDAVTTMDEIKKAEVHQKRSLRKPHPHCLFLTAQKLGMHHHYFYVGDLPDDMMCAEGAKAKLAIEAVAFPLLAHDPESAAEAVRKAGADHVLDKPSDLTPLVRRTLQSLRKTA